MWHYADMERKTAREIIGMNREWIEKDGGVFYDIPDYQVSAEEDAIIRARLDAWPPRRTPPVKQNPFDPKKHF